MPCGCWVIPSANARVCVCVCVCVCVSACVLATVSQLLFLPGGLGPNVERQGQLGIIASRTPSPALAGIPEKLSLAATEAARW